MGNEISKVQKIHFLLKLVKSDIDSGRSSKIVRNFLEIQSRVVISYPIIETQNRHFMFYLWLFIFKGFLRKLFRKCSKFAPKIVYSAYNEPKKPIFTKIQPIGVS